MTDPVVRCPYCVVGNDFREMVAHLDGRLVCAMCGHLSKLQDRNFRCTCAKCLEMSCPVGMGWMDDVS